MVARGGGGDRGVDAKLRRKLLPVGGERGRVLRLALEVAQVRGAARGARLPPRDSPPSFASAEAVARTSSQRRERRLRGEPHAQQPQVARIAPGEVLQHRERLLVAALREEQVGERGEAGLVDLGRRAAGLLEEVPRAR